MDNIKVFDEKGNPVIFRPIKLRGQHKIDREQLESYSIDFKERAKHEIATLMVRKMLSHLLFTEKELPDGGLLIESETIFYGE